MSVVFDEGGGGGCDVPSSCFITFRGLSSVAGESSRGLFFFLNVLGVLDTPGGAGGSVPYVPGAGVAKGVPTLPDVG